jgi:hypothetical protein
MAKGIWVKIRNEDWRPRKDIKHPHWFKCSNRILEDEDFYNFGFDELCVWIHILSLASLKDSDTVFINFEAAERKARLKEKIIRAAVAKLKEKQIDVVHVHDTYAIRTDHVHDPGSREEKNREEKNREEETTNFVLDFERVYQEYPRKEGKKGGLKVCDREIKTPEDYALLISAIKRYREHHRKIGTEKQFLKHFATFMGEWRDWLDPNHGHAEDFSNKPGSLDDLDLSIPGRPA